MGRKISRNVPRLAFLGLAVLAVTSCDQLLNKQTKSDSVGPVVRRPPTAVSLEGDLPVGRWISSDIFNVAALAESNRGHSVGFYSSYDQGRNRRSWEFRGDGTGHFLRRASNQDPRRDAFFIEGYDDYVWFHGDDFRWTFDGSILHIQTTRNSYINIRPLNNDMIYYKSYSDARDYEYIDLDRWWFRIGSPLHIRVLTFLSCVTDNGGRKLWDIVKCESPWNEADDR